MGRLENEAWTAMFMTSPRSNLSQQTGHVNSPYSMLIFVGSAIFCDDTGFSAPAETGRGR